MHVTVHLLEGYKQRRPQQQGGTTTGVPCSPIMTILRLGLCTGQLIKRNGFSSTVLRRKIEAWIWKKNPNSQLPVCVRA